MIRTQIYLTEQERDALRTLAAESGKKQSELIREAIDSKDLPDFRSLRSEWDSVNNSLTDSKGR